MDSAEPFSLFDCNVVRCAVGTSCKNLRDLLDVVQTGSDATLEHHMMRCALDEHFELDEFPNDLARWCWDALGDAVLAEELGLIDPYQPNVSLPSLRATLVNVVARRLREMARETDRVPSCRPGLELHLIESRVLAYDTGERFTTPAALAAAIPELPLRSLFYHVHEARRRTGGRTDDFSDWLERYGAPPALVAKLRAVDFYFLNLNELRREFLRVLRQHVSAHQAAQMATV